MSKRPRAVKQKAPVSGSAMRPNVQPSHSPRSDLPRRAPWAALVDLPRRMWQAGNAALSRLCGRQSNGGQPLAAQTQVKRERAFKSDCSDVLVHQDAEPRTTAEWHSATAFKHGDDLSLGAASPVPDVPAGWALIVHELAYVVQQRHAAELEDDISQPGDRFEQAADCAAQQAVQGPSGESASGGVPPAILRQPQAGEHVSREEVRAVLEGFLQRAMQVQSGRAWRVAPEVRNAVIGLFVGDVGYLMAIEAWLNSPALPGDPAECAGEVARRLLETIDCARLERLNPMSGQAPTPAAMIEQGQGIIERTMYGRTLLHQGGASSMVEKSLIGESAAHRQILEKLSKIAATDAEVLISGPSGVGKELYAHYVHQCSPRQKAAFVPVNCGALPADLLENELFGHVGGAFTGARPRSDGLVAAAEGGTLFLDEVDALALVCQVKLLRFLQEKEYRRLGETRIRRANVRIIAATNTDLLAAVRDGRFREDLFFRLRVVPIEVPALRERPNDIPLLLEAYGARYAEVYKLPTITISERALKRLKSYAWPGNIRELENCVNYLTCLQLKRPVEPCDLPLLGVAEIAHMDERTNSIGHDSANGCVTDADADRTRRPYNEAKRDLVEHFEREYIQSSLHHHEGNIAKAARTSGKPRRVFFELMRKHGISAANYRPMPNVADGEHGDPGGNLKTPIE